MRSKFIALIEKANTPAPDGDVLKKLEAYAEEWRTANDIGKAVDAAVAKAYAAGWHQGWRDAPSDEF
jgi:hypothetical protein